MVQMLQRETYAYVAPPKKVKKEDESGGTACKQSVQTASSAVRKKDVNDGKLPSRAIDVDEEDNVKNDDDTDARSAGKAVKVEAADDVGSAGANNVRRSYISTAGPPAKLGPAHQAKPVRTTDLDIYVVKEYDFILKCLYNAEGYAAIRQGNKFDVQELFFYDGDEISVTSTRDLSHGRVAIAVTKLYRKNKDGSTTHIDVVRPVDASDLVRRLPLHQLLC